MYFDLSIIPSSSIDIRHLIARIPQESYKSIALDFQFKDCQITPQTQSQLIDSGCQTKQQLNQGIHQQNSTLHQLSLPQKNYDIIAVKPLNQKIFHALCTQYENYDVICFNMGVKMPFMLKRNPVYEALRKGKYFQIQYDCMFDEATRVICMTNIINIFKATKGKNIIISSHVNNLINHRSPYDIASLMISLGMNKNQVLECMKQNVQKVIKSAIHRGYFKGAIRQISVQSMKKLGKKIAKHRQRIKKLK